MGGGRAGLEVVFSDCLGDRISLTSVVGDEEGFTPVEGLYPGEGVRDPAKGIHHWLGDGARAQAACRPERAFFEKSRSSLCG